MVHQIPLALEFGVFQLANLLNRRNSYFVGVAPLMIVEFAIKLQHHLRGEEVHEGVAQVSLVLYRKEFVQFRRREGRGSRTGVGIPCLRHCAGRWASYAWGRFST